MKRLTGVIALLILATLACNIPLEGDTSQETAGETDVELTLPAPPLVSEPAGDKWALWTDSTRLRGANLHPCKVFELDECIEQINQQDVKDLRLLGANVINASYPGVFSVEPPYELDPAALAYLDDLIGWAEEEDIFVVLNYRSGPGRNEAAIHLANGAIFDVWQSREAQEAWIEMWRFTADRYKDSPVVIGYNPLVEPHPNVLVDPDGEMEPEQVQAEIEGTLMDWNPLAKEITLAIREIDAETPIVIDSLNWADAAWFSVLEPTGDERTVYSPHVYDPDVYTMQEEDSIEISYPEVVRYDGERVDFSQRWLFEVLIPVAEFAQVREVPIFVGEFGLLRWVPGGEAYLSDLTELFEAYGWDYAHYVWRGDDVHSDGFNMEFGQDPGQHEPEMGNPLMQVLSNRWQQNLDSPQTLASP